MQLLTRKTMVGGSRAVCSGAFRIAWLALAILAIAAPLGSVLLGVHLVMWRQFLGWCFSAVILLPAAILLFGLGYQRPATAFLAIALVTLSSLLTLAASCIWTALAMPLQDPLLLSIDARFGVDWVAMVDWFRDQPALSRLLSHAYGSLAHQPWVVVPLAFAAPDRVGRVVAAWAATLTVTFVFSLVAPAVGGYVHLGLLQSAYPDLLVPAAWAHMDVTGTARAGATAITRLDGVITFPSFHAAAAVVLAYAWWQIPVLRWLGVPLNVAMLVSCVPCGGHYIVDVVAGGAVAVACLAAMRHLETAPTTAAVSWPVGHLNDAASL